MMHDGMMRNREDKRGEEMKESGWMNEEALTGLELIILIAVACIIGYIIIGDILSNPADREDGAHGGIIGDIESSLTNILTLSGSSYGMQDKNGTLFNVKVYSEGMHPTELGSASVSLKLIAMKMQTLDLNGAEFIFAHGENSERLAYSNKQPLMPGRWTIAERSSEIPFQSADSDNILEQNERFTLVINPSTTVPSGEVFELNLVTQSQNTFEMRFGVPAEIRSHSVVKLFA